MGTMYNTQDMDVAIGAGAIAGVAATGPLLGAIFDLIQINGPWGRAANYAALEAGVATFDGYAAGVSVVTWDAPSLDELGNVEVVGTIPVFRDAGAVTPNQIYGFLVQNAAKTRMLMNGPIDGGPIQMDGPLKQIMVTLRWKVATNTLSVSLT